MIAQTVRFQPSVLLSGPRPKLPVLVSFCVALAFCLATSPYIGIDHDSRLYVLMAYRWLSPHTYAIDPWFAFGSQDDWSFFSPYLALILKTFGVEVGVMLAAMVQSVLFAAAAVALGRSVLRGLHGDLAGWCIAAIPLLYSSNGLLYVAEGFVTARGLAVPLAMLALASVLRGKTWLTLAFACIALLMHPIMAFVPVVLSLMLLLKRKYDIGLLVLGCAAAFLFFVGGRFGYLAMVDAEWLPYVQPAGLVFIDQWWPRDIGSFCFSSGLVLAAALFAAPVRRRLYALVLALSVLAITVSYVAAYFPVVLVLQAQFWRGVWLLKVFALVALVDLVRHYLLRRRDGKREFRLMLMLMWMSLLLVAPIAALASTVAIKASARLGREWSAVLVRRYPWLVHSGCILFSLVLFPHYLLGVAAGGAYGGRYALENELLMGFLRAGGLGASALLVWCLIYSRALKLRLFQVAFALSLLVLSATCWDIRSDAQRAAEGGYVIPSAENRQPVLVPAGKTVLWHRHTERLWFGLGVPGYASELHANGLIFARGRTLLLRVRLQRVLLAYSGTRLASADLDSGDAVSAYLAAQPDFDAKVLSSYERQSKNLLSREGLKLLCGDQALDFVIDPEFFNEYSPLPVSDHPAMAGAGTVYLYACERVRRGARA